ncbi:MAG: HTH domain-containing protein [Bacteroidia bacterium]
MIKRKATGRPSELAKRLHTSERNVYKLVKLLKELGGPIYFDTSRDSYCYYEDVTFKVGFFKDQHALRSIKGGFWSPKQYNLVNKKYS